MRTILCFGNSNPWGSTVDGFYLDGESQVTWANAIAAKVRGIFAQEMT